jgi:hypothetical protein
MAVSDCPRFQILCTNPSMLLLGPVSAERLVCKAYLHLFWRGLLLLLVLLFPLVWLACSGGLVVIRKGLVVLPVLALQGKEKGQVSRQHQ